MQKAFENFKQLIEPFGLNEADFNTMIQSCKIIQFPKGQTIINAGTKQDAVFYMSKGIVRNYVVTLDEQISTYGFRMENMLITGYGLHNNKNEYSALVSVETLEECEMIKIPFSVLNYMELHSKDAHKVARYLAENHTIELVQFIISADTNTLINRYNNLEQLFPNIHQRVPQHIIASYLRITPVHLSRIKKSNLVP
jgi:CRP-like cAMP-binding protein